MIYANVYIKETQLFIFAYLRKCLPSYDAAIKVATLWGGDSSCFLMVRLICVRACACVCMKFIRVSVNVLVHPGMCVLACPGKCVSCPCMIVLVHLTVLATAITTLSGLQFQREKLKWEWKGRRKTSKLVKFRCEESLMRIILIIPDEGNRNSSINLFFSLHNNLLNGESVPLPKIHFVCAEAGSARWPFCSLGP